MASSTHLPPGTIPRSVQVLLDFFVRGYYKETVPEAHKTAASRYIASLEEEVDLLKDVVLGLYRERFLASKRLETFIRKWSLDLAEEEAGPTDIIDATIVSQPDPPEYVAGL